MVTFFICQLFYLPLIMLHGILFFIAVVVLLWLCAPMDNKDLDL